MAQTPLMHLERAKPLCCALVGWVVARGRLGISQGPSHRLLAHTQWLDLQYDQEPKMLHVKRMRNIALLVFVSYNLLVTVQSVKSDSYICVDKFPI